MTLHLNAMELANRGFKLVAAYQCIKKGERMLNVDCYTDGCTYIVRHFKSGRRTWDSIFDNKDDANAKVKQLWSVYSFHKRVA